MPPALPWVPIDVSNLPAPPRVGEVHAFLISLDEPPWPSAALWAVLEPAERDRAAHFHFEVHRRRFAHGRGLLRHVLGRALGVSPCDIRFAVGEQGKPRLDLPQAPAATLDFNLSHSADLALLALSDGAAVGADIEAIRPVPELKAIARQHFAASELAALEALPEDQQVDAFLACWTRKEAFVKALGGGLSIALDSFEVSLGPSTPPSLLACADPAHPHDSFTLAASRAPQGAWSAVVVRRAGAYVRTFSLR
jgi:4'-phosphopantetheinyl transferase